MPENIKYTGAPTVTPEEARRTAAIPEYRLDFPQVRLSRGFEEAGQEIGRATGVLGASMRTLGESIHSLGQTFMGAGNEMFTRAEGLKQLEVETKVNNAAIAWELDQTKSDTEFGSKSGEQANGDALTAKLQADEARRQKMKEGMSAYEKKAFDQLTTRPFINSARTASAHSATEVKNQAKSAVEAKLGLVANRVAKATEDADARSALEEGRKIIEDEKRYLHGFNDDQVERTYQIWATKAVATRALVMAEKDPTAALKFLNENRDAMDAVDEGLYRNAYMQVKEKADTQIADAISNKANQDRDAPMDTKEKLALEELQRIGRGDDLELRKKVIARTKSEHAVYTAEQAELNRKAYNTVNEATHGLAEVQNKKKPTNDKELLAVPGVAEQWGLLNAAQKNQILESLDRNARGNFPDNPETKAIFRDWEGAMIEDPQRVIDKMNAEPGFIDRLEIPEAFRDRLFERWLGIMKQGIMAEADSRVGRAWNFGVQEGTVNRTLQNNPEQRRRFKSFLSSELAEWHEAHPKQFPKPDDYRQMLNNALNKDPDTAGWISSAQERYKVGTKPPKDFEEKYMRDHPNAGKAEIEHAWGRTYIRKKLQEEEVKNPKFR